MRISDWSSDVCSSDLIAVKRERHSAIFPRQQPLQRLAAALQGMDGAGLLTAFIDREHQAAVHQLLVDVDRGGGQGQHHRSLDPIRSAARRVGTECVSTCPSRSSPHYYK